jgi:light-regulated signal transduction histidine kinase (bacteriophytochrome)
MNEHEFSVEKLEGFLSILAHDISAPFRQITAFLNILYELDEFKHSNKAQEYKQYIDKATNTADSHVKKIQDFASALRSNQTPEAVDVNEIMSKACSQFTSSESTNNSVAAFSKSNHSVTCKPNLLLYAFQLALETLAEHSKNKDPLHIIDIQNNDITTFFILLEKSLPEAGEREEYLRTKINNAENTKYNISAMELHIARLLVEAQNGSLRVVANNDKKSFIVMISLPAAT